MVPELRDVDPQFAGILAFVAVLQISIVSYARGLPYIEPSMLEDVNRYDQIFIAPERIAEPRKTETEEPKRAEKTTASSQRGPAPTLTLKERVASGGLLSVLGSKRRGGKAVQDVFSEGANVADEIGKALSDAKEIGIADSARVRTRTGLREDGLGLGEFSTTGGGGDRVVVGRKTETALAGTLTTEALEIDGKLRETEINSVMRRQLQSIRDCYEGALKRNRTLAGKVVVRFEIVDSGRTANIEFDDDSLGSHEVTECIARRAKFWRFPKPDGGSVFVAYPIVFAPAS